MPLDEAVDVPHLKLHAGLPVPAVLLAFQVIREEPFLKPEPVIRIEMRPMLDAVGFEPLVLRCGAHESLEVAARMQALPAPVRRREEGHARSEEHTSEL